MEHKIHQFQLDTGLLEVPDAEVVQLHPAIVRLETEGLDYKAGLPTGGILVLNVDQGVWHRVEMLHRGLFTTMHQFGTYGVKRLNQDEGTVQRLKAIREQFPWLIFRAVNPLDTKAVGSQWRKFDEQYEALLKLIGRRRNPLEASAYAFTAEARSLFEGQQAEQLLQGARDATQQRINEILDGIIPRIDTRRLVMLQRMHQQMSHLHRIMAGIRITDEAWVRAEYAERIHLIADIEVACTRAIDALRAPYAWDLPWRHLVKRSEQDLVFCRSNLLTNTQEALRRYGVAWRAMHAYKYFMHMVATRELLTVARYTRQARQTECIGRARIQLAELHMALLRAKGLDDYLEGTRPIGNACRRVARARFFVESANSPGAVPLLEKACRELDLGMARF